MPLSARNRQDGDKERTVRFQEQELKRARGAISCAECRRLKLKCDKTIPCSSCKRRGCASICPNGSLTTGQGTRFILADTDRLHRKIAEMSDRIRQLEDGLAILQSSVSRETHPLLSNDLVKIKSGLELHSAAEAAAGEISKERDAEVEEDPVDAFGTLAVRDDGAATFYGRSAGSESLLLDDKPSLTISTHSRTPPADHLGLHPEVNRLASTFPHGPSELPIYDLQDILTGYLPPWPRAAQLRSLYLEQAPWFFGAVTERQLVEEVFPAFYEEAAEEVRARAAIGISAESFHLPVANTSKHASSHELALMLVVFCYGALTDPNLPPAPHNTEAERYYQLTRAALSLEPVMDRPPSIATVQVLSLMGIYQGMVADEHSIESTWALMGLASKLAQSAGLHLDCSRFKLSAAETQKRRALFWELFITDCWQALATGRLPSFELSFVDTELPADPDETLADDGTPQPSFPAWKARWGKECVSSVVMGTLTAQPPKYSLILDLDRRIRDMPLPNYAQEPPPQGAGLAQTMSHYMPTNYLHLTLLYVHRVFFAHALMDHPTDPMRSQYAPSFLAGYRSASTLLFSLRQQFEQFPTQIARFWVLWTHAFSACVMLGSIVTRGGTTKTAQAALSELRVACDLFERAAKRGGRAVKFVPVLRKLLEKAQAVYFQGLHPVRHDIFTPHSADHEQDELSIFSGRTPRTVSTKSNRPKRISPSLSSSSAGVSPSETMTMASPAGSPSDSMSDKAGRSSQSPSAQAMEVFPGLEASYRTAVHPGLVAELKQFEGQLDQQIHHLDAYYASQQQQQQQQQQFQQSEYVDAQQQESQQSGYIDEPQQYVEQAHQHQQGQPQRAQSHMSWYQTNMPVEHQTYSHSASPASNQSVPQQQQYPAQYEAPYGLQYEPSYEYAHPQTQSHPRAQHHISDQRQHVLEQHQPDMYHHQQQQQTVAGRAQARDCPQGMPQSTATTPPHAHDIPVYGGVYSRPSSSKLDSSADLTQQHQDHPYAHDYVAYNHGRAQSHSVPEQRSEQWSVNMPPRSEGQVSYQTPPMYDAPPSMEEHIHVPALSQVHAHNRAQNQGQAQYFHTPHAANAPQPLPLQPQHTGQGHGHLQPANQYAQNANHGYAYEQQQQQQQETAMEQLHQQNPPGMFVQMGGHSLQETWTSFFQQELPGGGRRR